MSTFSLILALLIVALALKPAVFRARKHIYQARVGVAELRRRRSALSGQVRTLARESLHQRLTAGKDDVESTELTLRIAGLQRRVTELERIDRRVLVLDERRGLSETAWIVQVHRPPSAAPPMEPPPVTRAWEDGRLYFFYATDPTKAKRKAAVRFPPDQGFQVLEAIPHEGDLTEEPKIGAAAKQAQKVTA